MIILNTQQQKEFKQLARTYGLDYIVAFGSQITGYTHPKSDLDLAYFSRRPLNYKIEYQLFEDLQKNFPDQLIDLVNLRATSPLLRKKALLEGQLLYEYTPHSFVLAQMLAYRLFIDAMPLFRLRGII